MKDRMREERCYFTRKKILENEESKENTPICVLCDEKIIVDYLLHNCLCVWCEKRKEAICEHCVMTTKVYIHSCSCLSGKHIFL